MDVSEFAARQATRSHATATQPITPNSYRKGERLTITYQIEGVEHTQEVEWGGHTDNTGRLLLIPTDDAPWVHVLPSEILKVQR